MKKIFVVVVAVIVGVGIAAIATASRNGSGTYSLPAGNPVVTGTLITASQFNSTMADVATEMTDSLSRSGKGGMSAALKGVNGSAAAPAYSFNSETNSGLYRAASNDIRLSIGGVDMCLWASGELQCTGTASGNAGVEGIGGTNHSGLRGVGTGSAPGVYGVGAGADRAGVEGLGGTNGLGVVGTGNGAKSGVQGTGGSTSGAGVAGIGGATNGIGVTGKGLGTGAGGYFWNGDAFSGGVNVTTDPALTVAEGHAKFTDGNPASTTAFTNFLTAKNIVKAWANILTDGAGAVSVSDGFNIASVGISSVTLTVTMATAMSNTNYTIITNVRDSAAAKFYSVPRNTISSTTAFTVKAYNITDSANVDFAAASQIAYVVVLGAQ